MGTSSSITQIPALANKPGYQRNKAWMGLKAAIRFNLLQSGLWSTVRSEREPWRSILRNAARDFLLEQQNMEAASGEELESTDQYRAMMRGALPQSGSIQVGQSVWVFISSTFTDTMMERDLLLMDAYPFIREYCRQIGMDFNVVDFRWGIRQGASNRHMAADICYHEVERCRDSSIGPYFVAILGDKYGYRQIPPKFKMPEYHRILQHLEKEETDESLKGVELMKEWYKEDTNALGDSEFLLQPIDSKFKNFFRHDSDLSGPEIAEWYKVFTVLQTCIFRAVRYAGMDPAFVANTTQSITEGEIHVGLKGLSESKAEPRCFTFTRHISNLDPNDPYAKRFVDSGSPVEQAEKQRKLGELKEALLAKLPPSALYEYSLKYHSGNEEMMKDEKNKVTLRDFLDKFCHFMIDSIKCHAKVALMQMDNAIYQEVLRHSMFCRERAATVIGQEDVLEKLMGYLKQRGGGGKPFVIHGIGGSGKTALIAKLFCQSLESYPSIVAQRPIHLIRFIGITPQSSNIRDLLYSICEQICVCLGLDESRLPQDYKQLQEHFWHLLERASQSNPFMIFLDSLDQLSDEYQGRDLLWLPRKLPNHVHMLVTIRPDAGFCLSAIKNLINDMHFFEEIKPLNDKSKAEIVEALLTNAGRTLTKDQQKVILKAHQDNKPTALYMHIACNMAARWHSFTPLTTCRIAGNITGIITQLFEELEEKHGMLFVARALGYLTCSRSGLTPNELLDILSCDDAVLEDVFEHFVPPVRRLPPLLLSRLRLDLGDNLVESGADNMVVYRWYHRIFYEVAHSRYVASNSKLLHTNMADYFLSRWAHTPKPYVDKRTKKVDIAFRQVQTQPLVLQGASQNQGGASTRLSATTRLIAGGNPSSGRRYNLRKLTELPFHLIQAGMWDEVEKVLCSIPWIEAKCQTGRIYQLLLELASASDRADRQSSTVRDFYSMLRANAPILQESPELTTQQSLNEPDASACYRVATEYLKTTDPQMVCWQSLSKSQIQSPEVMTLTHTAPVFLVQFSPKGKFLATACSDNTVRVWVVASGALVVTIEAAAVKAIFPPSLNWVAILERKSVALYGVGQGGLSRGKLLRRMNAQVEAGNSAMFVTSNSKHLYLYSLGTLTIFNASSGKVVQKVDLKCRPKCVAFSPDGKLLAVAYKDIYLWDISSQKILKRFETDKLNQDLTAETSLGFCKGGKTLCGVLPNGTYRWTVKGSGTKWNGHKLSLNSMTVPAVFCPNLSFILSLTEQEEAEVLLLKTVDWCKLEGHKAPIKCAAFCCPSALYGLGATGSDDHTVRIWDTQHITGFTNSKPKVKQVHEGPVSGCVFSPDGSKAVSSCQGEDCILWELAHSVPQATRILKSKDSCILNNVKCISEDGCFVIARCNLHDFDIWNLKSTPSACDKITIMSHHRLIPYVNPNYLFVTFKHMALACFTTTNKPGDIFLYELMSAACVGDWLAYPDEIPLFDGYTTAVKEFHHGSDYKILAAGLNHDQKHLATIAVKTSQDSLNPVINSNNNDSGDIQSGGYVREPPLVRIWSVNKGCPLMEMDLKVTMSRLHRIRYLGDQLVIFMHLMWRQEANGDANHRGGRRSARVRRKVQQHQLQGEMLVQVLDPSTGHALYTDRCTGAYSKLHVPRTRFLDPSLPVEDNARRIIASCVHDGGMLTRRVGPNQPTGKFREKNDDVTAYTFSPDNTRAMVGVDDGTVHVLRLVSGANL